MKHLLQSALLQADIRAVDRFKYIVFQLRIPGVFSFAPFQVVCPPGPHHIPRGIAYDVGTTKRLSDRTAQVLDRPTYSPTNVMTRRAVDHVAREGLCPKCPRHYGAYDLPDSSPPGRVEQIPERAGHGAIGKFSAAGDRRDA